MVSEPFLKIASDFFPYFGASFEHFNISKVQHQISQTKRHITKDMMSGKSFRIEECLKTQSGVLNAPKGFSRHQLEISQSEIPIRLLRTCLKILQKLQISSQTLLR